MKNKSIYLLICMAALLFSSCAKLATLTVEKRHYRNGYYVDYNHNNKFKAEITKADRQQEDMQKPVLANDISTKESFPDERNKIIPSSNMYPNIPDAGEEKQQISKSKLGKIIKSAIIADSEPIPHDLIKRGYSEKKDSDEPLSMFWSVIVLIVVVWLIAYFTGGWGLGGLINLLLLVALILFILWLLRVV
jgi:hypothetical protein